MRKLIIATFTLAIIMMLTSIPVSAEMTGTYKITASTDVWSQPSIYSEKIGTLYSGSTVTAISSGDDWVRISYNGGIAFVKCYNLSRSGNSATSSGSSNGSSSSTNQSKSYTSVVCDYNYKVICNVNVRNHPATSGAIVGGYKTDQVVRVLEITGSGWGRTSLGWINLQYAYRVTEGQQKTELPKKEESAKEESKKEDSVKEEPVKESPIPTIKNGWVKVGSTWNYYKDDQVVYSGNDLHEAWTRIAGKSSGTNYYAVINNSACVLYIFKQDNGEWILHKTMSCSPGAYNTPTVKGTFTISDRGVSFSGKSGDNKYTCYWWTRFYNGYLFHSTLYKYGSMEVLDDTLGMQLSHGCVRLSYEDARWVNEHLSAGTKVCSY